MTSTLAFLQLTKKLQLKACLSFQPKTKTRKTNGISRVSCKSHGRPLFVHGSHGKFSTIKIRPLVLKEKKRKKANRFFCFKIAIKTFRQF